VACLSSVHKLLGRRYHVKHTGKKRKLDCLMSEYKGATNDPTTQQLGDANLCGTSTCSTDERSLVRGGGVGSACEVGCSRRVQPT